uniref:Uncharacterized protein n=1 Tax=Chenopodium quinoa TaxID=63459 RepID=A0A803M7E8_CHEQI
MSGPLDRFARTLLVRSGLMLSYPSTLSGTNLCRLIVVLLDHAAFRNQLEWSRKHGACRSHAPICEDFRGRGSRLVFNSRAEVSDAVVDVQMNGEIKACQQVANESGIPIDPIYPLAAWELAVQLSQEQPDKGEKGRSDEGAAMRVGEVRRASGANEGGAKTANEGGATRVSRCEMGVTTRVQGRCDEGGVNEGAATRRIYDMDPFKLLRWEKQLMKLKERILAEGSKVVFLPIIEKYILKNHHRVTVEMQPGPETGIIRLLIKNRWRSSRQINIFLMSFNSFRPLCNQSLLVKEQCADMDLERVYTKMNMSEKGASSSQRPAKRPRILELGETIPQPPLRQNPVSCAFTATTRQVEYDMRIRWAKAQPPSKLDPGPLLDHDEWERRLKERFPNHVCLWKPKELLKQILNEDLENPDREDRVGCPYLRGLVHETHSSVVVSSENVNMDEVRKILSYRIPIVAVIDVHNDYPEYAEKPYPGLDEYGNSRQMLSLRRGPGRVTHAVVLVGIYEAGDNNLYGLKPDTYWIYQNSLPKKTSYYKSGKT